jgi:hypothetical protein
MECANSTLCKTTPAIAHRDIGEETASTLTTAPLTAAVPAKMMLNAFPKTADPATAASVTRASRDRTVSPISTSATTERLASMELVKMYTALTSANASKDTLGKDVKIVSFLVSLHLVKMEGLVKELET